MIYMSDLLPAIRPKQMFFDAPGTGEVALEFASLSDRAESEALEHAALAGRKGAPMAPPPPPMPGAPPPGAPPPPGEQLVQEPPPPWFGRAAADAFPPLPPTAPSALSDCPYVEYVTPKHGLNEAAFPSTPALEGGGDLAGGEDDMADQMIYEGLTGHDAVAPVPENMADSVDAGGQEAFIDVMSQPFSLDDGEAGIEETLVEPGQTMQERAQPAQAAPSGKAPPMFTPDGAPSRNGTASRNGAQRNGTSSNGASRNGAVVKANSNGAVVPRNRVAAFENAARYRQGAGTAARTQEIGPPDPASYGYGTGMGQAPTPQPPQTGLELAAQFGRDAAAISSAAILRQPPPTFTPDRQQAQQQSQGNYTPWIVGAGIVGLLGIGWMIFSKRQTSATPVVTANPLSCKKCGCTRHPGTPAAHFAHCSLLHGKPKHKGKSKSKGKKRR